MPILSHPAALLNTPVPVVLFMVVLIGSVLRTKNVRAGRLRNRRHDNGTRNLSTGDMRVGRHLGGGVHMLDAYLSGGARFINAVALLGYVGIPLLAWLVWPLHTSAGDWLLLGILAIEYAAVTTIIVGSFLAPASLDRFATRFLVRRQRPVAPLAPPPIASMAAPGPVVTATVISPDGTAEVAELVRVP